MIKEYDVIIIGASLAGSSAAIELGKKRLSVALLDRATFPRRKPCGEGLSALGLTQLQHLGIRDRVLRLPHIAYTGYKIIVGQSKKFVRSPIPGGITVQRLDLDTTVLESALELPTVSPYLSCNVEKVEGRDVYLSERKLTAKKIVIACGGNSPLLDKICCSVKRYGPRRTGVSVLYKGEFLKAVNWVTIIVRPTFEMYCTPLADGHLNVSVIKRSNVSVNVHSIFSDLSLMKEVFEECCFVGVQSGPPQGRTNIGNVRRYCPAPHIFLAGDAKEEFDPIGGMGMSHALSSGIQVAQQIIQQLSDGSETKPSALNHARTISSMRRFTQLTYRTLIGAKYFPPLLCLPASTLGEKCIKLLLNDCL